MRKIAIAVVEGKIVRLNKRWQEWWGLCPHHYELTPSFCVTDEKTWYCFGCNRGGELESFQRFDEKKMLSWLIDVEEMLIHAGLTQKEFEAGMEDYKIYQAEPRLLGCLLLDERCQSEVLQHLEPGKFFSIIHQHIYCAMLSLFGRGEPIDLATLTEELKQKELLDVCGGPEYLYKLTLATPNDANALYYVQVLEGKK